MEDVVQPHHTQRSLLQIQEMNRKGRVSPLPQAVQGAQPQLSGPAGEPGIKHEFGRIFAGINSGVGGISSPVPARTQLPYTGPGLLRREDSDGTPQEMSAEAPVKNGRDSARAKRRKLKEEEGKDEDSTGRQSPAGRAKRPKTHTHHHHHHHHHHHAHHHAQDQVSSPSYSGNTPFKNVQGSTPIPSPPGVYGKDVLGSHHHHVAPRSTPHPSSNHAHASNSKPAPTPHPSPANVVVPKPKQIVSSKAVLDEVASLPRHHIGDVLYEPILKPARLQDPRTGRPPRHGYSSTPKPLPWDLIKDNLNCTLTVKVGKEHLVPAAREEITSRRAIWGTDVYTDDSDVVAACIHAGWIRGEWPEDVDIDMLDLNEDAGGDEKDAKLRKSAPNRSPSQTTYPDVLTEPPKTGPMPVPENRDLHVTLVILPLLQKYASTIRFAIKSREYGGRIEDGDGSQQRGVRHDGLSFMITGIRWVTNGAGTQSRLRGKARRERIRRALKEVESGPVWTGGPPIPVSNGTTPTQQRLAAEKAIEVPGSWWKHPEKAPSEEDKENQPLEDGDTKAGLKLPNPDEDGETGEDLVGPMDDKKEVAVESNDDGTRSGSPSPKTGATKAMEA